MQPVSRISLSAFVRVSPKSIRHRVKLYAPDEFCLKNGPRHTTSPPDNEPRVYTARPVLAKGTEPSPEHRRSSSGCRPAENNLSFGIDPQPVNQRRQGASNPRWRSPQSRQNIDERRHRMATAGAALRPRPRARVSASRIGRGRDDARLPRPQSTRSVCKVRQPRQAAPRSGLDTARKRTHCSQTDTV